MSKAANGGKNGWGQIDELNPGALDDIYDNGVRTVGMSQIPICSAEEAYNNWDKVGKGKPGIYPCGGP